MCENYDQCNIHVYANANVLGWGVVPTRQFLILTTGKWGHK